MFEALLIPPYGKFSFDVGAIPWLLRVPRYSISNDVGK